MNPPDTTDTQEPRFRIPIWIWVVTLAALGFFAFTLWQVQTMQRELNELQLQMRLERGKKETLEAQRREMEQIHVLLAAPETRAWQLKPVSPEMPLLKIFWNEQLGLLATSQTALGIPAGRVLQLWILPKNGSAVSAGTIQPPAKGNLLQLLRLPADARMSDAVSLTITIEPAGGSHQPSSAPTWAARIH